MRNTHSSLAALWSEPDEDQSVVIEWSPVELEAEIIAALDARADPSAPVEAAFRRKETELVELFGRLPVRDALELHRRLTLRLSSDPIAARFSRFVAARRARLLAFVADARRRRAQSATK